MALALSSASYAMVQNVASTRKADWNPMGVDVPYAVPEYVKSAPSYLDGSLVGDYGFDPLGLAAYSWPVFLEKGTNIFGERQPFLILNVPDLSNERRVQVMDSLSAEEQKKAVLWMREAELKHGRLAMLAAVGWPLGELVNWGFLHEFGGLYGRTPSVLNGAMLEVYAPFFFLVAGAASYAELQAIEKGIGADGDFAFDPLSVAERASAAGVGADDMRLKEVLNGRLAMLAITGFAVQEALYLEPVVEQTGAFFGRF